MELVKTALKKHKQILYLEKIEYDIFYSYEYKYPLLVVEEININTGKSSSTNPIKRSEIEDPWREDKEIPKKYRLTLKDYQNYMEYGGSLGHNTPAGHHKSTLKAYTETFQLSNISPQEQVFNTGLWNILEIWTKRLQNEPHLENIQVFTGNIPSNKLTNFNGSEIDVPDYMYKVVTCNHKLHENKLYISCFLMKNEPPKEKIHKIYKHLVSLKDISKLSNINFFKLFSYYNNFHPTKTKISSMNKITRIDVKFNRMLAKQMISSLYFGKIIYSKTLSELENNC